LKLPSVCGIGLENEVMAESPFTASIEFVLLRGVALAVTEILVWSKKTFIPKPASPPVPAPLSNTGTASITTSMSAVAPVATWMQSVMAP